jgi:CRISPR/Cas system CSM-associated protein Csm3 (group 7 of RAMP superfamily)
MSMLTIDLKIVTEAPLSIGTGDTADNAISSFVRDLRDRPCIPATTLKGVHRDAVEKLALAFGLRVCNAPYAIQMCHPLQGQRPCVVCQIFGSAWVQGRIFYRDLVSTSATEKIVKIRTTQSRRRRVSLNRERKLFEALPAGTTFTGIIQHLLGDKALLGLAVAALCSIRSIGAGRSAGIGLCTVQARALDSMKRPISERELVDALQQLKQSGQSEHLRKP